MVLEPLLPSMAVLNWRSPCAGGAGRIGGRSQGDEASVRPADADRLADGDKRAGAASSRQPAFSTLPPASQLPRLNSGRSPESRRTSTLSCAHADLERDHVLDHARSCAAGRRRTMLLTTSPVVHTLRGRRRTADVTQVGPLDHCARHVGGLEGRGGVRALAHERAGALDGDRRGQRALASRVAAGQGAVRNIRVQGLPGSGPSA